jgi:hypothetical protein
MEPKANTNAAIWSTTEPERSVRTSAAGRCDDLSASEAPFIARPVNGNDRAANAGFIQANTCPFLSACTVSS